MAHSHSHDHGGGTEVKRGDTHFDRIAARYNSSLPSHVVAHYLEKRVALLQSLVPPGPVLDVGCGTGLLAWRLAGAGYQVTGLDASRGMLEETPEDRPIARVLASATHLPFAEGSFPAVITVAMLHHIADPAPVAAAVREILRVTAPGGAAVIWDHNPRNPYWPFLMRRVPQDEEETRLIPAEEVLAALGNPAAGAVRLTRSGWVPEFVPAWSLPAFRAIETALEALPGIRSFSAHNVIIVRK